MFNNSEGRATCSVQRATCSLTGIDQWGLRHCTLVHSFVTSRLDYCSPLYIGLPATRLNRVLRSAARLIGRVSKFNHISAYMRDVLHWLPLRQRIEFRV